MKKYLCLFLFFFLLASCSKDDDKSISVDTTTVELNALVIGSNNTHSIVVTGSNDVTYSSENSAVATVSNTGLISAITCGETYIDVESDESSAKIKVTVVPVYSTYSEPILNFTSTKSEVINQAGSKYTETTSTTGSAILYSNYSTKAPFAMYMFNSSNKLIASVILVKIAYISELAKFLAERYVVIDTNGTDYIALMVNGVSTTTDTMGVGLISYNSSYYEVMYFPYTSSTKTMKATNNNINQYRDLINKALEYNKIY